VRRLLAALTPCVRAGLLAAVMLAACSPCVRGQAADPPTRSVLLLQSYQQGPAWVQNITDGVLSVFAQSRDFTFSFRFEYMNILDADPSGYHEVYRRRLGGRQFDLVIGADNQALEFLIANRSALFPGVPIVFCSVDDFSPGLLKGERDITGVTGDLDFEGTIELARRLHPGMKHLLVLANRGLAVESAAYARLARAVAEHRLGDRVDIEYWEDPKLSAVIGRAGTFPRDTVVFDMAFLADDAGRPLGVPASTRKAADALGLPIYSCWETLLGNGIVGGIISGGFQQGKAAAELALQILRGADADSLPVVQYGTNRPMFDYQSLERFRISEKRLPPDSVVINRPSTLYERFRGVLWAFVTAIAALVVLLALSWLYIVNQQRMKSGLRQSEERLSLALAATASGIWEFHPRTQKAYYDTRWFTMLGYEPGALPPEYRSWVDLLHPEDRASAEQAIQRYVDEGKDFTVEFRLRARDGRWLWISSSGKIVERDSKGSAIRIVGTHVDVSERKRTLAELEQANQNLERRVKERTRELAMLNELAAVVSRSLDLGEIMESALDKTLEAAGVEAGAAYRLEEQTQTLVLMAHRGLSPQFVSLTSRLPLEIALAGKQLDTENPLVWSLADYPEGELKVQIREEGLGLVIGVPVTAKGLLLGGLVISTHAPRSLSAEECALLMAVGRQIGLAVENAGLFERERTKHEEAERRRTVAEGLREVLAALNSNRPLQETLDLIIRQTCRVTGSDAASLLQRESPDGPFTIQSSCGLTADYVSAIRFSAGKGGAGRALAARGPVVLADAAAFVKRLAQEPDAGYAEEKGALEFMMGRGFSALLSVPLVIKDEDYGGITLYYRTPREFSQEEIQLAVSVADQAALAIENARLRGQAEQAAAFAERSRLARELHDSVTQSLYSITLYSEAVARMLSAGESAGAVEHLRELRATAQEALREMRLLIFQLSPPALEKGGLAGALQIRLDAVEARGGMKVDLQVQGAESLAPRVRQELYQVAQEALNNALKHARAQSVRILLDFQGSETRLEVSDDGCGFEPEEADESGGLGLRGMRERVQGIGGTLRVESAPGRGTTVHVAVPTDKAAR
jgi:PAS domain S-box-containing protein